MQPDPKQNDIDTDQTWKTNTMDPDATWPLSDRQPREEPQPEDGEPQA